MPSHRRQVISVGWATDEAGGTRRVSPDEALALCRGHHRGGRHRVFFCDVPPDHAADIATAVDVVIGRAEADGIADCACVLLPTVTQYGDKTDILILTLPYPEGDGAWRSFFEALEEHGARGMTEKADLHWVAMKTVAMKTADNRDWFEALVDAVMNGDGGSWLDQKSN
jgi:hypothetical protein